MNNKTDFEHKFNQVDNNVNTTQGATNMNRQENPQNTRQSLSSFGKDIKETLQIQEFHLPKKTVLLTLMMCALGIALSTLLNLPELPPKFLQTGLTSMALFLPMVMMWKALRDTPKLCKAIVYWCFFASLMLGPLRAALQLSLIPLSFYQ